MPTLITFINENDSEPRIDQAIVSYLLGQGLIQGVTRSQVKGWIDHGAVRIAGALIQKSGIKLKVGELVELEVPDPEPSLLQPYSFDLPIVYEDDELLVIDKPAGISMHPGAGNRTETVVNALLGRQGEQLLEEEMLKSDRPGIVHRLDKDTSGLVVVAKTLNALNKLSAQFKEHSVTRCYQALALSTPRAKRLINQQSAGVIDAAIGRHPVKRKQMAVLNHGGRTAITRWQKLEELAFGCLLELRLETGRTHQIRVHLDHIGSPVIGDPIYGNCSVLPPALQKAAAEFGRQALHAVSLGFEHPVNRERLEFKSELPLDFVNLLACFRQYIGA